MNKAREKANSDYAELLAADGQLAKAAKELVNAAKANAAFLSKDAGNLAVNDLCTQDSSAAANLLAAALKGEPKAFSAAAANEATAIKDANTIAALDRSRTRAFDVVARSEAEAQTAAISAPAGDKVSAGVAGAAAARAGAAADGSANPYAGAVENGAAAVANAASSTASAQHAMEKLKMLK